MPDYRTLYTLLGHDFRDEALPRQALTHRSFSRHNNERLEFLGDAILGFHVARELYQRFPAASEGELSRMRASLVNGEQLAALAEKLELGKWLQLGPGELKSGGRRRTSILADAFEAVIGAIYLDGGIEAACRFIDRQYQDLFAGEGLGVVRKDPKTSLQEYLQSRAMELPEYEVVDIGGKEHDQVFHVRCQVHDKAGAIEAMGEGRSRKKAEQSAASRMLEKLGQVDG